MTLRDRIRDNDYVNAAFQLAGCVWFCGLLVHWVGWEALATAKWAMRRET